MATNKSMLELLERQQELISEMKEKMDELNAINDVTKFHVAEQKRQGGQSWNDSYVYDSDGKEYKRFYPDD